MTMPTAKVVTSQRDMFDVCLTLSLRGLRRSWSRSEGWLGGAYALVCGVGREKGGSWSPAEFRELVSDM